MFFKHLSIQTNDSSTRARFLNIVNPFLEGVQANSGLSAFKVVMDDSNNTLMSLTEISWLDRYSYNPQEHEFIVLDFSVLPIGHFRIIRRCKNKGEYCAPFFI